MGKANRFIEDTIYTLKRNYGQPVALYIRGTVSQDPSTGNVTYNEQKWKIKKAPVLSANLLRKFQYDLSFIAANKNFTYGGFYDQAQRGILVDAKDLPKDFAPSLDDAYVVNHRRYAIKSIEEFEEGRGYIFIVEELKNQRVNEIQDKLDRLFINETVLTTIGHWQAVSAIDVLNIVESMEEPLA